VNRIPAVRCTEIRYNFGETTAVDGLDLEVEAGTVFGLLGPNGAGKTTVIRMITTLLPTRVGSIEVMGVNVARHKLEARRLIGYVPQQLSADTALTARENVALFARLFDVPRRERRPLVQSVLEAVGLAGQADKTASTFSGGMVRRLELAQALVNAPQLLVLDEPTIGLDPIGRAEIWEEVERVRAETGMTVLITTHYMDEADQHCDRIAMMHHGRIHNIGTPAELRSRLGPNSSLDDVFPAATGNDLGTNPTEVMPDVRASRRTAYRLD
jgi:ABC-2 type transport system ATP-binding protein